MIHSGIENKILTLRVIYVMQGSKEILKNKYNKGNKLQIDAKTLWVHS